MAPQYGYTGRVLKADLSSAGISEGPSADYSERFLGGRGIGAKLYWDEVPPEARAFDPENCLVFATGPMAGLPVLGGSRWQICGKSPAIAPERFSYSNLGGHWGAELKFAGYDALAVQGRSERPVYLFLHDGIAEIRDASALWGKGAIETREILKGELGGSVRVVAIGPAAENRVAMATILADNDASGSGGLGAVMGSKNLKAIAVKGTKKAPAVAKPERFRELMGEFRRLRQGIPVGIVGFAAGSRSKKDVCYGCLGNCARRIYEAEDGRKGKFVCQSALFYKDRAELYYGERTEVPFFANKLCDEYGLDTNALSVMLLWLWRCYRAQVLTDENTGMPLSKNGSLEFIESLVKNISLREGFGDVLAQGMFRAAEAVGPGAQEQLTDYYTASAQRSDYEPRLYITTALLFAMEPRVPIQQLHEVSLLVGRWVKWVNKVEGAFVSTDVIRAIGRRFWGGEVGADFSTYEGKALAAKKIQDRQYAKECLIFCDWLWPITDVEFADDHVGDPTFESQVFSAVMGGEVDEEGLCGMGERVFNLQRAILVREGHRGREADTLPESWFTQPLRNHPVQPECLVPGKGGEVICRKGEVVDRERFEGMKDEYYQLRQWDVASGLQTRARLQELGLQDIAEELARSGLVK
ncbi:MAG: aldehyde ferredoxin oxidoreductase N-terminal domain-containing protein [Dehalococcoidia bacterium]